MFECLELKYAFPRATWERGGLLCYLESDMHSTAGAVERVILGAVKRVKGILLTTKIIIKIIDI